MSPPPVFRPPPSVQRLITFATRSFLKEFSRKPPVSSNDQVRVVNDFLDFIAGKMRNVDPWKEVLAGPDIERAEDEFDLAMEAMEKLVMNRLWHL